MNQFSGHPLYRKHNIDSAMSSLWEFYKKKFLPLFLMSLVMSLIIQYVSSLVNIKELSSTTDPMALLEELKGYIVPLILLSVIDLLFTSILQYYVLYNPVDNENTVFRSVIRSLNYFIPYLIIMVLMVFTGAIAFVLGLIALIIGSVFVMLYIATLYMFILPVMMAENTDIANTISRTFKLTHRKFWSNIGWVTVFLIIVLVISLTLSALILIPFTGDFIKTIMNPDDASKMVNIASNPIFILLSSVINALTLPLLPIFSCIIYFNGKADEEQIEIIQTNEPQDNKLRVEDLYAKPITDDHPENTESLQEKSE